MRTIFSSKLSQGWGIDLVIGSFIFIFGIVIFYYYAINQPTEAKENIETLFYDGKIISDSILSEGSPKNWDSSNVVAIGILTDNQINDTKLEKFFNLDYEKTKSLFNTKYNYYFFSPDNFTINGEEIGGIGVNPVNPGNLIKITRFTVYKNKPSVVYLYVWE